MSEVVFVTWEKRNSRLVDGCYHYDAHFEDECPYCGELFEGSIDDLDSSGYGIGTDFTCPHCGESFSVSLEDCENDDEDGMLPVEDAALIWASNGKDEDYMFGYSWEELEDAL